MHSCEPCVCYWPLHACAVSYATGVVLAASQALPPSSVSVYHPSVFIARRVVDLVRSKCAADSGAHAHFPEGLSDRRKGGILWYLASRAAASRHIADARWLATKTCNSLDNTLAPWHMRYSRSSLRAGHQAAQPGMDAGSLVASRWRPLQPLRSQRCLSVLAGATSGDSARNAGGSAGATGGRDSHQPPSFSPVLPRTVFFLVWRVKSVAGHMDRYPIVIVIQLTPLRVA
jgi:hypothetical protein